MLSSAPLKMPFSALFCALLNAILCSTLDSIFSFLLCSPVLWKAGMYGYDGLVKLVRMGTVVCLKLARMLVHMVMMVQ